MSISKCFECGFPTSEVWTVVPKGRPLPLCRKCQTKVHKPAKNPYAQIIDAESGKAKERGKYKMTPELQDEAIMMRKTGMTYQDIAEELGLSAASVFKACRGKV